MQIDVTQSLAEIEIGATGIVEIVQNVKTILSTIRGTVPLDREFGIIGEYIDKPLPMAKALSMADIVEEVEKQEPRVEVTKVALEQLDTEAIDGILKPIVRIKIKEGVL